MEPVSALSVAASACQFAEQTLKVSDALIDYFRKVKNAPKLSRELRQEALLLSDVLENLRSVLPGDSQAGPLPNSLNNTVKEFEDTVKEMAKHVEIKENELSWKRFRWPFDQKDNEKYLEKLERFKNTFQLALQTIQKYCWLPMALILKGNVGRCYLSSTPN
jgi:hypothetical protein